MTLNITTREMPDGLIAIKVNQKLKKELAALKEGSSSDQPPSAVS